MKRAIVVTLLLCVVIAWTASLAQADEPLIIVPHIYDDGAVIDAHVGEEILIREGWAACTRGLTEAFRRGATIAMEIQYGGQPYVMVEPPGRDYWGALERMPEFDTSSCVMATNSAWRTYWHYSLGTLEAGQYEAHLLFTLSHPLPDGGDYDGDGRIDIFSSENFFIERTLTIDVQ